MLKITKDLQRSPKITIDRQRFPNIDEDPQRYLKLAKDPRKSSKIPEDPQRSPKIKKVCQRLLQSHQTYLKKTLKVCKRHQTYIKNAFIFGISATNHTCQDKSGVVCRIFVSYHTFQLSKEVFGALQLFLFGVFGFGHPILSKNQVIIGHFL